MLDSLLNILFGCTHRKTTFPLTPSRSSLAVAAKRGGAYVVCLKCGSEFAYDWREMRVGRAITTREPSPSPGRFLRLAKWLAGA
jgi:hypothetical protein